jgi:hypothetical protein
MRAAGDEDCLTRHGGRSSAGKSPLKLDGRWITSMPCRLRISGSGSACGKQRRRYGNSHMAFEISIIINSTELDNLVRRAPELDPIIADLVSADIREGAYERAPKRTGFMANNIVREVIGAIFRIIAMADYSGYVEFGTRKMGAQPFMVPATEAADIDGACQEALDRVGF